MRSVRRPPRGPPQRPVLSAATRGERRRRETRRLCFWRAGPIISSGHDGCGAAPMNLQRPLLALTVLNLVLLAVLLARLRPAEAHDVPPVLRGRALEIVDDAGKVRASLKVYAADPNVAMPDG